MATKTRHPVHLLFPDGRAAFLEEEQAVEKAILELRTKLAIEEDPETRDILVRALDKRLRQQTTFNRRI
jgi:hypothetical protein